MASRLEARIRPYRPLRGRTEFARVYRAGTRRRRGPVTIIEAAGPAGPASLGFVAGRKVGSAVSRNRAKRRMREAASRISWRRDTAYVLIADRGVVTIDFGALIACIVGSSEVVTGEEAE